MNKARRAKLQDIAGQLEELRDDEQGALDNLPDSFRDGPQGEKLEANVEALDEAIEAINQAIEE